MDRHDLVLILGLALVSLGIAALSAPLAVIFAGVATSAFAYLDGRNG